MFPARCLEPATWMTPGGPRCDACAEIQRQTISDGACLLVMLPEVRGEFAANVRARLLAQFRRFQ